MAPRMSKGSKQIMLNEAGVSPQHLGSQASQLSADKIKHANAVQTLTASEIETPQIDRIVAPSSLLDSIQPGPGPAASDAVLRSFLMAAPTTNSSMPKNLLPDAL